MLRFIEDYGRIYIHGEEPIQGLVVIGKCPVCEKFHSFHINKLRIESEDGFIFYGVQNNIEVTSDQHSQTNYVELACGHHVILEDVHPVEDFPVME